ncbi:DNA topoisomerase II large subunit [Aeromonas phage 65]|uniref:DNA topoisomerase (ATP-hydrolyzing) n=2 Tax=Ishigurovirus osborne TaxID=260149 RepID=A0A219YBL6_9CAUD|nr:DNA topoisomerase II [Aeromonas phage 65]AAR90934.2 DNA topoisomerase II large subunit [Aeromonas phage 65]APU01396.1 DNA topoisomerase [Aeromonas phage 65.2]
MKEQEGKILSHYEHIFLNSDMYVGSLSEETHLVLENGKFVSKNYIPGLAKVIDEIVDNSVDEAIRTDFKYANKIDIVVDDQTNQVTISDNGRGIPQYDVTTPEGEVVPYPLACYTRAMAGGNFVKERKGIGKNGVGSVLTNLYSTMFRATTCDGKNTVTIYCTQNAENQSYTKKKGGTQGTTVEFIPDLLDKFGIFGGIPNDIVDVIKSRVEILSVLFPQIKFTFNKKKVDSKFKKFASDFGDPVIFENEKCSFFIGTSDEFRQLSYVNGVHTKQGGNHVEYLINGLCDELTPMIKRKFKVEINKSRIKENTLIFMSLRGFEGAKFDGQTKERLSNSNGQIKDHCGIDLKAIAKRMISNDSVIMPIVESAIAKRDAVEKALATKAQKKALTSNVPKHIQANKYGKKGFETVLFLTEGDSALGFLGATRDHDTQGGFPLRGKMLSVHKISDKTKVLKNAEITNIISILGITLDDTKELPSGDFYRNGDLVVAENDEMIVNGKWVQTRDIITGNEWTHELKPDMVHYRNQTNVRRNTAANYDYVSILVDADPDGRGHISNLIISLFHKYWKHYIDQGRLLVCRTPEYISRKGKDVVWCYDTVEFNNKKFAGTGWKHEHVKGLGQLNKEDYKKCIRDPYMERVSIDGSAGESLEMFFGNESDLRKAWMDE